MNSKLIFSFLLCCTFIVVHAQRRSVSTEQWRPVYHFTPDSNWTNDPNGLVYIDGVYHLFHQYNPFANEWGHMSWGHSTSKDLIHWKHLPVAMKEIVNPDDTISIFSGSAVWDSSNTSGFCKTGGCMVAVFTGNHNLRKEAQYIMYSNDTGRSFVYYDRNPVIDLSKKDFRDPNVIWHAETNRWIMSVALPTEFKIRFYGSRDLKTWEFLSEFAAEHSGETAVWECPSLLKLPVDGNASNSKWVLLISAPVRNVGAAMRYFVGSFDGNTFINERSPDANSVVDYGDCFYAAIPWNGLPRNQHTSIGWLVPGPQETSPWKGQMSIPRDLALKTGPNGIELVQIPASVIKQNLAQLSNGKPYIIANKLISKNLALSKAKKDLQGNAYWIEAEIEPGTAEELGFKIAANLKVRPDKEETLIGYKVNTGLLYIDRGLSPNGKINVGKKLQEMKLPVRDGRIKLQILVDRSSIEIFANDGERVLTTLIFPTANASDLSFYSKNGECTIRNMTIWNFYLGIKNK